MPHDNGPATQPALVSILRQGTHLIASIHTALDDSQLLRFQHDLIERVGLDRARGIIIDVAALDVLDSFGTRTLRNIAQMANLRGARTVIVGINPDVAIVMVELGTDLGTVLTALDLEEGLKLLTTVTVPAEFSRSRTPVSYSDMSPPFQAASTTNDRVLPGVSDS
jgi:rsbT antagonist protein RsbS